MKFCNILRRVIPFQNNPENLDLSYKIYLDLWIIWKAKIPIL